MGSPSKKTAAFSGAGHGAEPGHDLLRGEMEETGRLCAGWQGARQARGIFKGINTERFPSLWDKCQGKRPRFQGTLPGQGYYNPWEDSFASY